MSNQVPANGTLLSQLKLPTTKLIAATSIQEKIADLKAKMDSKLPGLETALASIHKQLLEDTALVHILSDEEVGVICNGLARAKQIILVTKEAKSSRKSLSKTTIDDLG